MKSLARLFELPAWEKSCVPRRASEHLFRGDYTFPMPAVEDCGCLVTDLAKRVGPEGLREPLRGGALRPPAGGVSVRASRQVSLGFSLGTSVTAKARQ